MESLAAIIDSLDGIQLHVLLLIGGVVIFLISTFRFGIFKKIATEDRIKLQWLSAPFLLLGFAVLILSQIIGGC